MLSEGVVLLANCSGQTKPARGVIKPMAVGFLVEFNQRSLVHDPISYIININII